MNMTRRISFEVSDAVAERLDEMAARRGIEIGELFRQGIGALAMLEVFAEKGMELTIPDDNAPDIDGADLN